jgi:hypothetical protein
MSRPTWMPAPLRPGGRRIQVQLDFETWLTERMVKRDELNRCASDAKNPPRRRGAWIDVEVGRALKLH